LRARQASAASKRGLLTSKLASTLGPTKRLSAFTFQVQPPSDYYTTRSNLCVVVLAILIYIYIYIYVWLQIPNTDLVYMLDKRSGSIDTCILYIYI
jgi:hypothetical protein